MTLTFQPGSLFKIPVAICEQLKGAEEELLYNNNLILRIFSRNPRVKWFLKFHYFICFCKYFYRKADSRSGFSAL